MSDIEPTEQKPQQPKPFSTEGYLILTTLWVVVLPGVVVAIPLLVLQYCAILEFPASALVLSLFALSLFLLYRFNKFRKRFAHNVRIGNIPNNFLLRYLPFYLPLFYVMAVTAVAFCFAPISPDVFVGFIVFSIPWYLPLTAFVAVGVMVGGGIIEAIPLVLFAITLIVAACGTIYVTRKSSPAVGRNKGLAVFAATFAVLVVVIGLTYWHFRTVILFPLRQDTSIVQDERGRHHFLRDTTDLSEYQPFSENNKLVKIESPTLSIDDEHPGIHGALALYPVYAAAIEAIYQNLEDNDKKYLGEYSGIIQGGTSPSAFDSLITRRSDMLFMLQPSAEQLREAELKGRKLTITPIGDEAFVFFVSKTNPVNDLTVEQIREIYSRKITRWNEVGGKNERILPFQRPEGSGSQTRMLKVMGDVPLAEPQKEEFQKPMRGIVNRVADYRNYGNSIGFSFRYYVEGMFKHDGVKLLKINGIEPTVANIQNGKYPLIGPIMIVTAGSKNPNVPKLIDWFLSPQGQELIAKVGYVPMLDFQQQSSAKLPN